jgi:hypothetical protein
MEFSPCNRQKPGAWTTVPLKGTSPLQKTCNAKEKMKRKKRRTIGRPFIDQSESEMKGNCGKSTGSHDLDRGDLMAILFSLDFIFIFIYVYLLYYLV